MRDPARNARVAALLALHGGGDPRRVVARLCADLLADTGASAPVDLEMLASFRRARVEVCQQSQPETIAWNGRNWVIRVRGADTPGRQRFSTAHAVVHTFFMEAERDVGALSTSAWSEAEEELCDAGAAELLLPRHEFLGRCPPRPTMDDIVELADEFEASAEATAIRAVTLSPVPAAMVVLEPTLKPKEIKAMAKAEASAPLPGMEPPPPPPKRLRVQKSFGSGMPFIPKWKSVPDDCPLADLDARDEVTYEGSAGFVGGRLHVSARRLPVRRDGALVDRMVVVMFDAGAVPRARGATG